MAGSANARTTIRVALADNHPLRLRTFETWLNAQPDIEVVAVCADGREAVETTQRTAVDVLLMDIRMPVMDGVEAARLLSVVGDRPYVIVLTEDMVDELVLVAVRAGARGFLRQDTAPDDLLTAIRTVDAGQAVIPPAASVPRTRPGDREDGDGPHARPAVRAMLDRLTDRELLIFELVGAGRNNNELAATLELTEATVATDVARLLMKLQCRDRVALVVLAHAAGLRD